MSLPISFLLFLLHSIRKRSFLWCDFEIQKRTREEKGERERREERSKGSNFHGKSNENHGREMKTGEGGAKSGKEKMVLVFFFPLFLIFPFQIKTKGRTMNM